MQLKRQEKKEEVNSYPKQPLDTNDRFSAINCTSYCDNTFIRQDTFDRADNF